MRGETKLHRAIQRARATPIHTPHLRLLRICTRLTQQELRAVTFEVGADYDALSGDTLADKARSLITAARRHNSECWLIQAVRRQRTDLAHDLSPLDEVFC
ncbi:MAG: hypothetical protein ACP5JG_13290 [Anaerolineae bacterium]